MQYLPSFASRILVSGRLRPFMVGGALCLAASGAFGTDVPQGVGLENPSLALGLMAISDYSTAMPFLDLMKESRPWIGHDRTNWHAMTYQQLQDGGYLDANGWLTRMPPGLTSVGTIWAWGNASDVAMQTAAASRAGVYVLHYEGSGALELQGDVRVISEQRGEIIFQNLQGRQFWLNITETDPGRSGDYIRDITVVKRKYQDLLEAGELFNPDWLAVIANVRTLRFMDWMNTNSPSNASDWTDRPEPGDATYMKQGAPVEVMVQLANQTGTEPWFNMPTGASDEYMRQFATYVRDHLAPGLIAHVEYSNETWNGALPGFKPMATGSKTAWGVEAPFDYYAMQTVRMGQIWKLVFGATAASRLDIVLGTQTANPFIARKELEAAIWKAHDPAGFVPPASVVNSLGVTTYFGSKTMAKADLRADLLSHIQGHSGGEPTGWLTARLQDPDYPDSLPQIAAMWAANKAVAKDYGLRLEAYEGGQHVLQSFAIHGISEQDMTTLTDFLTAYVRSPQMADLYTQLWAAWTKVGDGPFMQYGDVSAPSKFGAWGLLASLTDSTPRATALFDLNAKTPAWFAPGGPQFLHGVIRIGTDGDDTLTGTMKDDFLIGGRGNDTFIPGTGHDTIHGGAGVNTVVLAGAPADYTLVAEGEGYRLTGKDISDKLLYIQNFRFDGGVTETLAQMLKH